MSATGLNPETPTKGGRVPPERLAEFDRLMATGGIEAVIEAIKKPAHGEAPVGVSKGPS